MKRYFLTGLIIVLLITVFYCSKEEHPFVTFYKGKGIKAVVISGRPSQENPVYKYEEVLSLGGEEPEPVLFQPGSCLIDDEENLYFTDEGRIKKFDKNGKFIRFIGNKGQGPGEVNYPSLKQLYENTIFVGQSRWRGVQKFEVFNTDGEFVKRINYPKVEDEKYKGRRNSLECYIGEDNFLMSSSEIKKEENYLLSEPKFIFITSKGDVLKEIDLAIEKFPTMIDWEGMGTSMPFVLTKCPVIFEKKIYILSNDGTEIYIFSKTGDMQKAVKLDYPGPVVSGEEKEKFRSSWPDEYQPLIRKTVLPDIKPFVYDIIPDDSGNLWLNKGETFYVDRSEVNEFKYMIIDEKGKYIADQVFPIELLEINNGFAYGFKVMENGLKIFKKYRLLKNSLLSGKNE